MNELQVFQNSQFGQVRVIEKDGEPWFVAKDVCTILGLEQVSRAMDRLDEDERGLLKVTHPQSPEKQLEVNGVNESGLYQLIIASNKPEAKTFKRWITHEVIPSIRKHGAYMTPDTIERALAEPDFLISLATQLKEARAAREELSATIEQQKPMVLFAESCIASNDSLLVREVAKLASKKGIIIGEKRLWQKLREWGVVNRKNEPYQHAFDAGWFEMKQGTYNTPYGSETYRTYKVTPKGQVYIIEKLRKELQESD